MTVTGEGERGACTFGAGRIAPLLDAFAREIEGVRRSDDIEHIHRMRVASRRLRAALPLFAACFPTKEYASWMTGIRQITRALGDARDADVQMAFLARLERQAAVREGGVAALPRTDAAVILMARLEKRRTVLQKGVTVALDSLEKSGTIPSMKAGLTAIAAGTGRGYRRPSPYGIPPVAADRIARRLDLMLSFGRYVRNPDAIAEHHAMRIAAKNLRYTMEVYAPLYRLGLKKFIVRVKMVQDLLGELHDCDVWIDTVMAMLLQERRTAGAGARRRGDRAARTGSLRKFLSERERERRHLHQRFVRAWESLERAGTWDGLRTTLRSGGKRRYAVEETQSGETIRSAVSSFAARYPQDGIHARAVTAIALQLFDQLSSLHRLKERERLYLESACLLHEIGSAYGQRGHGKRGAAMVLADPALPLGVSGRGIISLVSRAHRGRPSGASRGIYSLLSTPEQETVQKLSALIRVADALDCNHAGHPVTIHASLTPDSVVIDLRAPADMTQERERALRNGALFSRVYGLALVIR